MPEIERQTQHDRTRDGFAFPSPRRMGVHAVIMRGRSLLLVTKPHRNNESVWSLPGGSAAPGETPDGALSRVLAARLRLEATAGDLLAFDFVPAKPGLHCEGLNFVYAVRIPDGVEPVVTETGWLGEARWVERSAISEYAAGHPLRRIEQSLLAKDHGQVVDLLLGMPRGAEATAV
ncbi:NUDIX hydrolase [Streptomyces sp. NPDC048290]|uniref:NUDIX hydrolase n=1 Tax=Streptomyces sp. NPDC048290 TaxID=3155811 RepID=UPI003417CA64